MKTMTRNLFKLTIVVSSMTLISRLLGFIRDIILAIIFGAGPDFDAFIVGFKIPNFMRRLFGEGAFTQAFVPVLSDYQANRQLAEVQGFINHIAGSLGAILLIIVAIVEINAPMIVMTFAPGFVRDPMRLAYAMHMLRITSPYLLFIGLTSFSSAILNTFNRFGIAAFTPVLLNISLIVVASFWSPYAPIPIYVLAWGVLIGGIMQFLLQLPFLYRLNLLPAPKWQWNNPGVMRVLKLMIPAIFGVSVAQISLLIDNFFASFLAVGSISWLYYSDRLIYLPLGVIGIALATVVLPNLARQHGQKSIHAYSATLDWALRIGILMGVPSAVGLFILSGPLLVTLIYHGAFTKYDVIMTRRSLSTFSVGLPGFILVKILASAFYSRQDVKTPVKIAAASMLVNLILNIILIHPLAHAGLALATSLAASFNAALLLYFLLRDKIYVPLTRWVKLILRSIFSNSLMGFVIYWFSGGIERWLIWSIGERIWHLILAILLGLLSYILTIWISGLRMHDLYPPVNID